MRASVRGSCLVVSWALVIGGCVDDPSLDPGHVWHDGDRGQAQVVIGGRAVTVEFVVEAGHALAEGDIDLGLVEDVVRTTWAGGPISDLGKRWPSNVIPYTIVPSNSPNAPIVDGALAELAATTALTFVKTSNPSGDYLEYVDDVNKPSGTGSSIVGYSGGAHQVHMGMQGYVCVPSPAGCPAALNQRTIWHETLHALGWFHELGRPDRDAFVDIYPACHKPQNAGDYALNNNELALGIYDYASTMHYSSNQWCENLAPLLDTDGDGIADCDCLPVVREGQTNTAVNPTFIGGCGHSKEDVNSLWWVYPRTNLAAQAQSKFASAMATGDFDGDGYDDIAVGIPGHDAGTIWDTGLVEVYRGTSRRPVAWQTLVATEGGVPGVEIGDQFGTSVATGDLDRDGNADLVIGAPGEDRGSAQDAGMVHVYLGCNEVESTCPGAVVPSCQHGLRWAMDIAEDMFPGHTALSGERFGQALAVADTDNDGVPEIIVGAPGERHPTTGLASGAAFVFDVSFGAVPAKTITAVLRQDGLGTADAGDQFGAAIAAGDLDTVLGKDLIVGAPEPVGSPGTELEFAL